MAWMHPMLAAGSEQRHEDQLLAALMAADPTQTYEYKILHSGWGGFRGAERMQAVLAEEAQAQWELLIKLDDQRLVLRRPQSARARDVLLRAELDPYRTQVGTGRSTLKFAVILLAVLITLIAPLALRTLDPTTSLSGDEMWIMITAALVAALMMVVIARVRMTGRR